MWLMILGLVMIAFILGVIYLVKKVSNFGLIIKVSKNKKSLKELISFMTILIVFLVLRFTLSLVNAIIILLNVALFFIIYGLIFRVIKKLRSKEFKFYYQGWFSLLTVIIYLSIGFYLCHNVWQTNYVVKTNKDVNFRIALIADSHIGTTFDGEGFKKYAKRIEKQKPDMVVVAGDYVDDSTKKKDLEKATKYLGKIKTKYGIFYSYGNHDEGYFNKRDFNKEELKSILEKNNINILADEVKLIDNFYVIGRKDKSLGNRKEVSELVKGLDKDKYKIVIDHEPNDYDNEEKSGVDLVLSGHTHGGQLFLISEIGGLFFKANDKTYGYERRGSTDFIVTSGISDWELDFKTGTKSEYVIIDVKQK